MKKYTNEVVVGLFVVCCTVLLVWVYSQIKGRRASGTTLYAHFDTVSGLLIDNSVTKAGVNIGKVGGIELFQGRAKVRIQLYPGIAIRADDTASVQAKSLLGEKVLMISSGNNLSRILQNGEEIKKTLPTVDITDLFAAVPELMKGFRNMGPEIKPLAQEITTFVKYINKAIEQDPKGAKTLLLQIGGLISETRKTVKEVSTLIRQNRWYVRKMLRSAYVFTKDKRLKKSLLSLHDGSLKISPLLKELKDISYRFNRLLDALPPRSVRHIVAEVKSISTDLRKFSASLKNSGGNTQRLIYNLDKIFRKLAKLEEWHLRKFVQVEGVKVHVFGTNGQVKQRLKQITPPNKKEKKQ